MIPPSPTPNIILRPGFMSVAAKPPETLAPLGLGGGVVRCL